MERPRKPSEDNKDSLNREFILKYRKTLNQESVSSDIEEDKNKQLKCKIMALNESMLAAAEIHLEKT